MKEIIITLISSIVSLLLGLFVGMKIEDIRINSKKSKNINKGNNNVIINGDNNECKK